MNTLDTGAITRKCDLIIADRMVYKDAVVLQESFVKGVLSGSENEKFILLEHPHVITLGRGFHSENLLVSPEWLREHSISVEETGRGGDVTYHGPGQVVGYPILDISDRPDLHLYLRNLEELMIRCLQDFGIRADRRKGMTGIWVEDEKIGAIGVRVVKWVTSHGFALNVNTDLNYFEYIVPCGIQQYGVTSIQRILGQEIPLKEVQESLVRHFEQIFRRHLRK